MAAKLTVDFLTPGNLTEPLSVETLEDALIGLPVDQPQIWAQAGHRFDLSNAFDGQVDQATIEAWLTGAWSGITSMMFRQLSHTVLKTD